MYISFRSCAALFETPCLTSGSRIEPLTIRSKTRCVLLHYDSSKHCTCPLNECIWAFKVVRLFLKHCVLVRRSQKLPAHAVSLRLGAQNAEHCPESRTACQYSQLLRPVAAMRRGMGLLAVQVAPAEGQHAARTTGTSCGGGVRLQA
jgi:hypothetical protein